jgi:hypothetical protein
MRLECKSRGSSIYRDWSVSLAVTSLSTCRDLMSTTTLPHSHIASDHLLSKNLCGWKDANLTYLIIIFTFSTIHLVSPAFCRRTDCPTCSRRTCRGFISTLETFQVLQNAQPRHIHEVRRATLLDRVSITIGSLMSTEYFSLVPTSLALLSTHPVKPRLRGKTAAMAEDLTSLTPSLVWRPSWTTDEVCLWERLKMHFKSKGLLLSLPFPCDVKQKSISQRWFMHRPTEGCDNSLVL